ncbi:MAG: MlaD family protein [bacterium]|nr:MlaD family protein [bacterium]
MRFSSSFKVGILTLVGLIILLFAVLWVKGRSFSAGNRIEIIFKDVNGMRAGSGVQMMGLRVGQVEEITPVINGDNSYVKLKFVITEPGISVPRASVFSIQQSGLIGEQFLEITPPKTRTTYVTVSGDNEILYKNDSVQIMLDKKYYDVGRVKSVQILSKQLVPPLLRNLITTKYAYKVDYVVDLPGLILPDMMKGSIVAGSKHSKKLRIAMLDNTVLPYPHQSSPYTVIEPRRISDFMDLQYKAAESLTETTLKVNSLLSDDVILDLKQSVQNINILTAKASTTVDKAEKLLDASKKDIDEMMLMARSVTDNFNKISNNVNDIIGDKNFKTTMVNSADSIGKLANNLNKVLDKTDANAMAADLQATMKNLKDISTYVANMTRDEKLQCEIETTITNINTAMSDISNALELVNKMTPAQKTQIQTIVEDTQVTTKNLRKFSEKLNKRFLLFRLMF